MTCNAVVKSFGAEAREDARLGRVLNKWSRRTYRHWTNGTWSGTTQMIVLLGLRASVTLYAIWLWWQGRATPGGVTFVLTSYFIVHGYLRDVGQHVANLQRSVNEMEDLVEMHVLPLGVADRPDAEPIRIGRGEVLFDRITFRYGAHLSRSSRTSPCASRRANAWAWSATLAPVRPPSSSCCSGSTIYMTAAS